MLLQPDAAVSVGSFCTIAATQISDTRRSCLLLLGPRITPPHFVPQRDGDNTGLLWFPPATAVRRRGACRTRFEEAEGEGAHFAHNFVVCRRWGNRCWLCGGNVRNIAFYCGMSCLNSCAGIQSWGKSAMAPDTMFWVQFKKKKSFFFFWFHLVSAVAPNCLHHRSSQSELPELLLVVSFSL